LKLEFDDLVVQGTDYLGIRKHAIEIKEKSVIQNIILILWNKQLCQAMKY
jgi:hypothetical protein